MSETNWDKKTDLKEQTFKFFLDGMKTLWELLGDQKKKIMIVLAWMVFLVLMELSFPLLLKVIIDEIPKMKEVGNFTPVFVSIVSALFIIKMGTIYLDRFSLEKRFLKSLIFLDNLWPQIAQKKLLELSLGYHEKENTGKKIAKIQKGCDRLAEIMARLRWGMINQLLYLVINLIIIFFLDWRLGILFIIPFFPATWLNLRSFRKFYHLFEKWDEEKEKATGIFCQSIINIQTVQNYVQETKERKNFGAVRDFMAKIDIEASLGMQKYFFGATSILSSFFILTILAGVYLVVFLEESSIGTIAYIFATGSVTFNYLWFIIHEYVQILRNLISVKRMKELLDEKQEIKNYANAIIPQKFSGQFSLENVQFSYPKKNLAVLDNISFDIHPGSMIALVGKSGEGKTTLVKLICRMYDISQGLIKLDGVDIQKLDLYWYRKKFAIVQQDVDIFDTTILENIRYSEPDAPKNKVIEALRAAYLQDVLEDKNRFPNGLETQVGERGVKLSGGERQRVGIARAYLSLLNGTRVLILDEATSNLDSQAERAIQEMIGKLKKLKNISIIAIAHRLSTIQRADMIYVINNGKIVEQGNHNTLIKKNGHYAQASSLQNLGELRE